MCGLGSITLDKTVGPSVANRLDLAVSALLNALDHRGGDACGIMAVNSLGRVATQKAPMKAKYFNEGRNHIPHDTRAVAVHTRMATQGHEGWNRNNHPVRSQTTHVMHNGMVWDDHLKRQHGEPEVDTYAIALAAAEIAGAETPGHQHALDLAHAIAELEGSMAVIVVEEGAPFMATMRIDGSPLYTATVKGVRISASTFGAVQAAADALGINIPQAPYSYEIKKKGRKKTHSGMRADIKLEDEGYVAAWCAGMHTDDIATLPTRYRAAYTYNRGSTSMVPYTTPVEGWTDDELYGIGHDRGTNAMRNSGNWDAIPDEDLDEQDANYERIARKLLNAGDDFDRCVLCDEMTNDCETWHTVKACAECRQWYRDSEEADDGTVTVIGSYRGEDEND